MSNDVDGRTAGDTLSVKIRQDKTVTSNDQSNICIANLYMIPDHSTV